MSRDKPIIVRDHPYFSQYKWPQEEWGIWCIPVSQVEMLTGMRGVHQQHSELDCRWAATTEKNFLANNGTPAGLNLGGERWTSVEGALGRQG